jgi:protein-tyrosine kinase
MSIIEKAVERLEKLKRAASEAEPESAGQEGSAAPTPTQQAPQGQAPKAQATRAAAEEQPLQLESQPVEVSPEPVRPSRVSRIVEIDLHHLAKAGLVTPDNPKSMLAEECRVIKRPLIQNARGNGAADIANGNLIMITSSLPGEGKTFNAINLAMSMAMELDYTVLLVDADFSRPTVLSSLGLPREKGLMDVLTGEVDDLSSVILRTNVEKLSLLPAGMPHQRATELIASEAMARMLDEIATRYHDRIVVFDSPPLLATTEARVLASRMGQIVVVVEADRTSRGALNSALATIESCPVKLLLLNKLRHGGAESLYGYGYGYGYGHGDPEGSKQTVGASA